MSDTKKTKGSCQCGAVTYTITDAPMFTAHCCCTDCQKASGSDHITLSFLNEDQVSIIGKTTEFAAPAESGNINTRVFCPVCGSRLFGRNSAREGMIGVHVGTMDTTDIITPSVLVYARNRRSWDKFSDDLKVFDGSSKAKS